VKKSCWMFMLFALFITLVTSTADAGASCPLCVPPYRSRSNYTGWCFCVTRGDGCDVIGSCDCYGGGCSCSGPPAKQRPRNISQATVDQSTDVLSAKVTEHPWLQSASFANDLKTYSPALEWSVRHVQKIFQGNKISTGKCMGKLGGGTVTEDGGMIVFDLTRAGSDWTLVVARFDKAQATAFHKKMKTGEIDPRKDFFASPEATLHINGTNWTLQKGDVTPTGVISD